MILEELTVKDLKKELAQRNLPTAGNKNELVLRLRAAIEDEDLDPDNYDFQTIEDINADGGEAEEDSRNMAMQPKPSTSGNFDLSQLMAAMNQMMTQQFEQSNQKIEQKIEQKIDQTNHELSEKIDNTNQKIEESNQKIEKMVDEKFLEMSTALQGEVEKVRVEMDKRFEEASIEVKEQLQIFEKANNDIEQRLDKTNTEVQQRFQLVEKVLSDIKEKGIIAQVMQPASAIKLKPPVFDGTSSFSIFKLQFETAANQNYWTEENRVAALIVALKGGAAEILQIIPERERNDYDAIMRALERKYGSDHKREIYRLELKGRYQRVGETLQEFAAEVERLVHLAHSNMSSDYVERIKIDTFVDGIRDPDTRKVVVLSPKSTFAETITCALTIETASAIIKPAVKIRQVEIPAETANNNRWSNRSGEGSYRPRCWICDQTGHISRDCRELKRKRTRSPMPILRRPREDKMVADGAAQTEAQELN